MFAKKSIDHQPIITENSDLSQAEVDRQIEILKRNELVGNSDDLAQKIFEASTMLTCTRGFQIIYEGEEKDDVFFLLFGDVSITRKGKEIDTKSAPSNIGELAANTPGDPRTADISVVSETVRMRVISGAEFRKIRDANPEFEKALNRFIAKMNRSKIAQLGQKSTKTGMPWYVLSAIVSLASMVLAALLFWMSEFSWLQSTAGTLLVGIFSFVAMLLLNPDLIYRNMFRFSGFAVVGLIAWGSASWAFRFDGAGTKIPLLIDFNAGGEMKTAALVGSIIALLLLAGLSAHHDRKMSNDST